MNENKVFLATADNGAILDFAKRNGLNTLTLTSAAVWVKDINEAHFCGAQRCSKINTKKNKVRGNWYVPRI